MSEAFVLLRVGPERFSKVDEDVHSWAFDQGWSSQWNKTQYVACRREKQPDGSFKKRYLARAIMGYPDGLVDHINGDKLDNRRSNLRVVDHFQSAWNRRSRGYSSKYKGVKLTRTGYWVANAMFMGRDVLNKSFASEEEAARAYDDAARAYYGDYARLNFPNEGELSSFGNEADLVPEQFFRKDSAAS